MHKNNILVDTLQLIRTVSKRQKYRSQKARLAHLKTFLDPGSMDRTLMDWVCISVLAGIGAYVLGFKVWYLRVIHPTWHQLC